MPVFNPTSSSSALKSRKVRPFLWTFLGVIYLSGCIFFRSLQPLQYLFNPILSIFCFITAFNAYQGVKKSLFLTIDEGMIHWRINPNSDAMKCIYWKDIRWMKREYNGSISFYQDSSFSENIALLHFSAEEQRKIEECILFEAGKWPIKIIGFS